jgi:hypothetical protein
LSHHLVGGIPGNFREGAVDAENIILVVGYEYAFVAEFENFMGKIVPSADGIAAKLPLPGAG